MAKQRALWIGVGCLAMIAGGLIGRQSASGEFLREKPSVVYELRTYTTAPGRLPALHKRFRDHTLSLFEKHGIKNVIYWTPTDKENTLVYVVSHQSRSSAKKSWGAFVNDPAWKKAYAESKKDGPIVTKVVSQFLKTTKYSPKK